MAYTSQRRAYGTMGLTSSSPRTLIDTSIAMVEHGDYLMEKQTLLQDWNKRTVREDVSPAPVGAKFGCSRGSATRWTCIFGVTGLIALLFYISTAVSIQRIDGVAIQSDDVLEERTGTAASASPTVLQCFEVHAPVLTANGISTNDTVAGDIPTSVDENECIVTQTLMIRDFASSYGQPFVGNYTPPSCSFNRVTINFTVEPKGRQYDRLALMYLGDTEVWRTSTAEPTANGIRWTYIKDMSGYLALFSKSQKLIFDLPNNVYGNYTGIFNTTLSATFFTSTDAVDSADMIVPVSARKSDSNAGSAFTVPSDNATNILTLPRNLKRAIFTISACGQAEEEFWWENVPSSDTGTFPAVGPLYGYSAFREVQLFIDGQLAGVDWPFPVIFTGGVVPVWRPVVGIQAFDLREHEIDVTPFLPLLADGHSHNFTIKIAGLSDDGSGQPALAELVNSNWPVTGKIFLWLDTPGAITTGTPPTIEAPDPSFTISSTITTNSSGGNDTLTYSASASRYLSISATINTTNGTSTTSWRQIISFSNEGIYTDSGSTQFVTQQTNGLDVSSPSGFSHGYSYPIEANTTTIMFPDGSYSINATVNRGLSHIFLGNDPLVTTDVESLLALPDAPHTSGQQASATRTGMSITGTYFNNATLGASSSTGTESQWFQFAGVDADTVNSVLGPGSNTEDPTSGGANDVEDILETLFNSQVELYWREVRAANNTLLEDNERLVSNTIVSFMEDISNAIGQDFDAVVDQIPGRGGIRGPSANYAFH